MSKLQPSVAALVLTLALGGCTMTAEDQGTVDQVVEAPMSHAAVDYPDSIDPVLTPMTGKEVRIPNTTPAFRGQAMLHASALKTTPLGEVESLLGHRITSMHDPLQDLELALYELLGAAKLAGAEPLADTRAAQEALDVLLGTTAGRVYDGFALLNHNRGAFAPGHVPHEYKMKRLVDSGETVLSQVDGEIHKIWEVDINMLWYGQNFDSDAFLVRVPFEAQAYDELRVNWRVYSLIQEDLAPTTITNDGFGRIFHGLDSSFATLPGEHLSEISVRYPSLKHFRGMYIWGWGSHPPRVQFLQPIKEIDETGRLNPGGQSFATRTREDMTLAAIGDAAPEKKAYIVAMAALNGATGDEITAMLTDPATAPTGTFRQWTRLADDLRQLPPEAWDVMAKEGYSRGDYGDYDIIIAYMNNEIYGETPFAAFGNEGKGGVVRDWDQSDVMRVKIINLDNMVHYYRNVDFSAQLTDEMDEAFGNGKFSFEKFNPKPSYGVPKVAEMQWRTGWGYVPHLGIAGQDGLFPRPEDRVHLATFTDQFGQTQAGYQYQGASGYWRFNPPEPIRAGNNIAAGDPLRDADGKDGVKIGLDTEGFGVAKMPAGVITTHPNRAKFAELKFPGFLRNPSDGGDIIPPTPVWAPFLTMNPETGTLRAPNGRYWTNYTYFHGRPIDPNSAIFTEVEAPRAGGQLFYQFDPLFHDNMIFSLHPRSDAIR